MSSLSNYPDRRAVVGAIAAVPALPSLFGLFGPTPARAQTQMTSAGKGFSFAAYGDSRPMMYLPVQGGESRISTSCSSKCSGWSCRRRSPQEVVKKDVKMIFDPATKELIQIVMPFRQRARS